MGPKRLSVLSPLTFSKRIIPPTKEKVLLPEVTDLEHGGGSYSSIGHGVSGAHAACLEGPLREGGAQGVQESHHQSEELQEKPFLYLNDCCFFYII